MRAYLYVLDTLADWEVGYLTAELHSGRYLDPGRGKVELVRIGATSESVTTMGGLRIVPEACFADIAFAAGDLLLLPGADTWQERAHGAMLTALPSLLEAGVVVAAICGATTALASAGILDHRDHTSNDASFLRMFSPGYHGAERYQERPVVVDGTLITASGLAPLEFAEAVFRTTGVMRRVTLDAWYQLHKTGAPRFFHALMESMAAGAG